MWNRTKTRREKDLHGRREGGCSGRKVGCGFTRIVKDRAKSITAIAEARLPSECYQRGKEATKSQGTPAVLQSAVQVVIYNITSTSPPLPPLPRHCLPASCSAASARPQALRLDHYLLPHLRYCYSPYLLQAQREKAPVEAHPPCEESEHLFLESMPRGPHDQAAKT